MLRQLLVRHAPRRPAGFARVSPLLVVAGLSLVVAGCSSIPTPDWSGEAGAAYRPANYVDLGPIPADIRRVGVLAIHSDAWRDSELTALDTAFAAELAKFDRFETIPISRADLQTRFGQDSYFSTSVLPAGMLDRLHADFGLDAVVFVDLTHYSPYQPIAMGVRSRLVAVAEAKTLWAFDALFDAAQPDVAVAARRYQSEFSRPAYPLEDTSGILQSPARFAKYVAHAVFSTLPGRNQKHPEKKPAKSR